MLYLSYFYDGGGDGTDGSRADDRGADDVNIRFLLARSALSGQRLLPCVVLSLSKNKLGMDPRQEISLLFFRYALHPKIVRRERRSRFITPAAAVAPFGFR